MKECDTPHRDDRQFNTVLFRLCKHTTVQKAFGPFPLIRFKTLCRRGQHTHHPYSSDSIAEHLVCGKHLSYAKWSLIPCPVPQPCYPAGYLLLAYLIEASRKRTRYKTQQSLCLAFYSLRGLFNNLDVPDTVLVLRDILCHHDSPERS